MSFVMFINSNSHEEGTNVTRRNRATEDSVTQTTRYLRLQNANWNPTVITSSTKYRNYIISSCDAPFLELIRTPSVKVMAVHHDHHGSPLTRLYPLHQGKREDRRSHEHPRKIC